MLRTALLLTVAASFIACAEPEPELVINSHVFFLGGKIVEPDDDNPFFSLDYSACAAQEFGADGVVATGLFADVSFGVPAHAILMQNRLANTTEYAPIGKDEELRTDSNLIQLQEIRVTFDADGPFSDIGDGGVSSNPHSTLVLTGGGFHLASSLVTPDLRRPLEQATERASGGNADAIVPSFADVQAFGTTVGGDDISSNVLTVPISFCAGCRTLVDPAVAPPFPPFTDYCLFES